MKRTLLRSIAFALLLAMGLGILSASTWTSNKTAMADSLAYSVQLAGQNFESTDTLRGDVNGDGVVNASDAILVLRYALNVLGLTTTQLAAADCNGDGVVDSQDALIIMRYCIGNPMPDPEPGTTTEPTIIVDNATAAPGATVQVTVRVENNPGVAGAVLTLSYDSNITLTAAVVGDAFAVLQYTRPGQFVSPCNFSWDSESGMATEDGTIITLTFAVSNSVSAGDSLNVALSYRSGDIYDEDLNDVDFNIVNGHITIN